MRCLARDPTSLYWLRSRPDRSFCQLSIRRPLFPVEAIVEAVTVRLDETDRRIREMNRQDQGVGIGNRRQEFAARGRRLLRIPVDLRTPVELATLDHVM